MGTLNIGTQLVDVILGAQWGDEGKGKIVDMLARRYEVVARFQGGPNAGHTIVFNGEKHVLHTIPSGIFQHSVLNFLGNGVVIDPISLVGEIDKLEASGVDVKNRLFISRRAHLILPTHPLLDEATERSKKGGSQIGSTLKGIGPTYTDKTARTGLRVGDLERDDMRDRYFKIVHSHERLLGLLGGFANRPIPHKEWFEAVTRLRQVATFVNVEWLHDQIRSGCRVLAEGAQGTLLDLDFGTYPFVTSSHTTSAGACMGLGIPPSSIGEVVGVFKAYCTRVGNGPFPTELDDETGERIRVAGNEFGSTTGRPRRCGWLDLPALKYAVRLNGITELAMMKSDVLSGLSQIKICTGYRVNGKLTDEMPYDLACAEPHYVTMPGWEGLEKDKPLPKAFARYVEFIQKEVGVPISIISIGPDREDTIMIDKRGDKREIKPHPWMN